MRDLNTFLRPALDNNQISKEEDQAIRDYRRRYSNRRSQEKKRNEEASQYAILKQSLDEHKTYTIELKKLLDEEKLIYKDLQENLKQKDELQQKYSYLLTEGDDDDLNSVTTIVNSDDNVVNLSDNDYQPSS